MTADAAAALLGTSPTILSHWEERSGYPVPELSADGQALYPDEMMIAPRDALGRELSIASAITSVQRAQSMRLAWHGPATPRCDRLRQRPGEAL